MTEINFPERIIYETAYIGLLREELELCKIAARELNKPAMSTRGKIDRIDFLKRAMRVQVEIRSKEDFIKGLEKHVKQI